MRIKSGTLDSELSYKQRNKSYVPDDIELMRKKSRSRRPSKLKIMESVSSQRFQDIKP